MEEALVCVCIKYFVKLSIHQQCISKDVADRVLLETWDGADERLAVWNAHVVQSSGPVDMSKI